jgi:biotin operon repressor
MNGKATSILAFSVMALFFLTMLDADPVSGAEINEGTIMMEADEGDEVTDAGYPVKTASPGEELEYRIWVNNDHELDQTVIMELLSPEGWNVYVTGSVQVTGNGRNSILLDVAIPKDVMMDPEGEYQIRIDGIANLTGDRAFVIAVVRLEAEVDHELLVYPDSGKEVEIKVYPGQRTYMEVLLRNQGDLLDDLTITIGEHQSSWDARFQYEDQSQTVNLQSGTIYITKLLIGVPDTAKVGDTQTISVRSVSEMYSLYQVGKSADRIDFSFKVINPSTLSVQPVNSMVESRSGEQMHLRFDLMHNGVKPSTFEPALKILSGPFQQRDWQYTIDIGGSYTLEVGEIRTVTVHVASPGNRSGIFDIILDGKSDNANVVEGKMTVVVNSDSNISYSNLEVSEAKMGSDIIVNFRVHNDGESSTQVILDLEELPSCFISDINHHSFNLAPSNFNDIKIILYPKSVNVPMEFSFKVDIRVPLEDKKEWVLATEFVVPVTMIELPNVAVTSIVLPNRPIDEGENIQVNVTINNPSNLDMSGLTLELYEISYSLSNNKVSSKSVSLISGQETTIIFNWSARPSTQKIRAILVPPEGSEETDNDDNDMIEPINVIPVKSGSGDPEGEGVGGKIETSTAVVAAGGGAVVLTSLLLFINTEYVRYPLFASLFPLYSKLKPEHLLSNRLRKRIYVYVQNNPGEHFRAILVNLNLTNGTLAHHLYTLEKENLIRSQRDGLYRRFYPAGYHIDEDRISLSPIQKKIIEIVQQKPGLSQKEISEELSVSNSTVNYNIKALKEKGQIVVKKSGKSTYIYISPDRNA